MNLRAAAIFGLSLPPFLVLAAIACSGTEREPVSATPDASRDAIAFVDVADTGALPEAPPDPKTCEEAVERRSYVGCDYWPTVTSNIVADVFDFAVAVANVGAEPANLTVTGNGVSKQAAVAPGAIATIYLPWVAALKGPESIGLERSVLVRGGAYHLVSDKPVVVYQFSPLEFKAGGGAPGKDWSKCVPEKGAAECYSYSNDASLLLPSTAMTGAYRVMGDFGFSQHPYNDLTGVFETTKPLDAVAGTALTITATADATKVEVRLGRTGVVVGSKFVASDAGTDGATDAATDAGDASAVASDASADASDANVDGGDAAVDPDEVPSVAAEGTFTLSLNAGDVAQIVARKGQIFDFSGTLVIADKPVQVITSIPCQFHPLDTFACDHEEETVFPAETLGKHYVVTTPTGPFATPVAHSVRIYGHVDGTVLTYKPRKPAGCPDAIGAGDVVDCPLVNFEFEVTGDKAFGVGMFMLGAAISDPAGSKVGTPQGDPAQSFAVAVEQYRQKYVFLAPTDYKTSYVDIVAGADTKLALDNADITSTLKSLAGTGFFVARVQLAATSDGAHSITANHPVGIQVIGYGDNTSFQYPGGLNLVRIEPTPK